MDPDGRIYNMLAAKRKFLLDRSRLCDAQAMNMAVEFFGSIC